MMNKIVLFVGVLQVLACSPRVVTDITKGAVVSDTPVPITIFQLEDKAPEGAIKLGTVRIDDGGFTTRCKYKHVIAIAIEEARKAGGDALKITSYTKPYVQMQGLSIVYYNCHEIDATILKLPDATN